MPTQICKLALVSGITDLRLQLITYHRLLITRSFRSGENFYGLCRGVGRGLGVGVALAVGVGVAGGVVAVAVAVAVGVGVGVRVAVGVALTPTVAVAVAVGVGDAPPQGLTGQWKISIEFNGVTPSLA